MFCKVSIVNIRAFIVVTTIGASIDGLTDVTAHIVYIGLRAHLLRTLLIDLDGAQGVATNLATEVVTAKHCIHHIGATIAVDVVHLVAPTDIGCSVSVHISVTSASKGTHHTTAMEVEGRVTLYCTCITRTIYLIDIEAILLFYTTDTEVRLQVFVESHRGVTFHHTHLTTTESEQQTGLIGEEHIGVALHYRCFAITSSIDCHGATIDILTRSFQYFRLLSIHILVNESFSDIDDRTSIDMSTIEASAVDVSIDKGGAIDYLVVEGLILGSLHIPVECGRLHKSSRSIHVGSQRLGHQVGVHIEPHLHVLHLHDFGELVVLDVDLLLGVLTRFEQAAVVSSIVGTCYDTSIVTSAHYLLIDDEVAWHVDGVHALIGHATLVTSKVERAHIGCHRNVVPQEFGLDVHRHTLHVGGHVCLFLEVDAAEGDIFSILACILGQDTREHHVLTVTTEEHAIDGGILAHPEGRLGCSLVASLGERSAVTSAIHVACHHDSLLLTSRDMHQGALHVRAEIVECFERSLCCCPTYVIVVGIFGMLVPPIGVVGIGIRTVTATVDIAYQATMDVHITAVVHGARDIVTAIDVVDAPCGDIHTGGIAGLEVVFVERLVGQRSRAIAAVWVHIRNAASTVDVVGTQTVAQDGQDDTVGVPHLSAVTTRVEVVDVHPLQVPCGTYAHGLHVVATEDAAGVVVENSLLAVYPIVHSLEEAQLGGLRLGDAVECAIERCSIIGIDDRVVCHCHRITTAIDMSEHATLDVKVGLGQCREGHPFRRIHRGDGDTILAYLYLIIHCSIAVTTITTTIECTDDDGVLMSCGLCRSLHDGIPRVVHLSHLVGDGRHGALHICCTDDASDVVTAIDSLHHKSAGSCRRVDVHIGTVGDIGHTCTAIDATLNHSTTELHVGVTRELTFVTSTIDIALDDNLSCGRCDA